jgi:hypothetical protein
MPLSEKIDKSCMVMRIEEGANSMLDTGLVGISGIAPND